MLNENQRKRAQVKEGSDKYLYIFFSYIYQEVKKSYDSINRINKMTIFILFSIVIIAIYFIFKNFYYSAKRDLFKNQAAWSGKDLNIKYSKSKEISESKENDNYLKIIAEESKVYLEDQSGQELE